jgi:hypothetical protein
LNFTYRVVGGEMSKVKKTHLAFNMRKAAVEKQDTDIMINTSTVQKDKNDFYDQACANIEQMRKEVNT